MQKMCTLAAYALLGSTKKTRKIRFREGILFKTEFWLSKGLDSRLPFLKMALCNQVLSPVRKNFFIPCPGPNFHEGEIITLPAKLRSALKFGEYFDTLSRFNQAGISFGLQAIPSPKKDDEFERYVIIRCGTELMGDLRISTVAHNLLNALTGTTALYVAGTNQILVSGDLDSIGKRSALAHEIEHAIHFTILEFAGLPWVLIPKIYTEYLSMLVELSKFGSPDLFILGHRAVPALKQSLHTKAALLFIKRFKDEYGIRGKDVPGIAFDLINFQKCLTISAEKLDFLTRIREFAQREHTKIYEKIFGLCIEDIREIISELPNL